MAAITQGLADRELSCAFLHFRNNPGATNRCGAFSGHAAGQRLCGELVLLGAASCSSGAASCS
jgi:hypothetical protein